MLNLSYDSICWDILAYDCVYYLCIGPCVYDILPVVFKNFVQLLALWGRVHHKAINKSYLLLLFWQRHKLSQNIYDWHYV